MKRKYIIKAIADLTSDDPEVQNAATWVLEAIPDGYLEDHPIPRKPVAAYIPKLCAIVERDVSMKIKMWCLQIIGESRIQSPEVFAALMHALALQDEHVLATAIWAVGEFGRKAETATYPLMALASHRSPHVRWRAIYEVYHIGYRGSDFVELCATALDDESITVREHAAFVFQAIADKSEWSVSLMQRYANDRDDIVRHHARSLLQKWNCDIPAEDMALAIRKVEREKGVSGELCSWTGCTCNALIGMKICAKCLVERSGYRAR